MTTVEDLVARHNVLFVGVGNVLKGDDGAGVFLTSLIEPTQHIQTLVVETGIENYIGKINSMAPDIAVIVDAAHLQCPPGTVRLFDPDASVDTTTHTHNIALRNLAKLFNMPCMVLGIQPVTLQLGQEISPVIRRVCRALAEKINRHALHIN